MFQVGLVGNRIDLCSIHQWEIRVKNLDSMMMANLPPVMLPPITDYGMLTPTLGIKVSRFTLRQSWRRNEFPDDTKYTIKSDTIPWLCPSGTFSRTPVSTHVKIDKSHETVLILVRVKALSRSLSNWHFIRIVFFFWQSDYRIAAGNFSDDCKHFDLKKDYYLFSSFFLPSKQSGRFSANI